MPKPDAPLAAEPNAPKRDGLPVKQAGDKYAGLVRVTKDGRVLHVHPTTLGAHEQEGWKAV